MKTTAKKSNIKLGDFGDRELIHLYQISRLLEKKKYDAVIIEGRKALADYPNDEHFYMVVAIACTEEGDFKAALDILEKAESRFPDDYQILFQLGKVYYGLWNLDASEHYYQESYDATPEDYTEARSDCLNELAIVS